MVGRNSCVSWKQAEIQIGDSRSCWIHGQTRANLVNWKIWGRSQRKRKQKPFPRELTWNARDVSEPLAVCLVLQARLHRQYAFVWICIKIVYQRYAFSKRVILAGDISPNSNRTRGELPSLVCLRRPVFIYRNLSASCRAYRNYNAS